VRVVALALALIATSYGGSAASAARPTTTPVPRCADGRPQSEIDHAGALPFPVSSAEIVCVAVAESMATSHDRTYRLRDTRMLHVFESTVALQPKPTAPPLATGRVNAGKAPWSWTLLDALHPFLVLQVDRSDVYVELGLPVSDRDADLRLLQSLASTVALP
jgi:hypothetical protein